MENHILVRGFKIKSYMKKIKVFILIVLTISCNGYMYDSTDLENILGVKVDKLFQLYSYEETSGIQGEGYLFNKYSLSDETIADFIKLNSKDSFPIKDSYKENWEVISWQKGLSLNNNILDLLTVFEQHKNNKLLTELSELKNNLNKNNNYYSFFYKDSVNEPYAIELFVLNPTTKTFWVINIIT